MAGVLKHLDDVFCYIKHRDGVYHPIYVESEGVAAAAPLVNLHASAEYYNSFARTSFKGSLMQKDCTPLKRSRQASGHCRYH